MALKSGQSHGNWHESTMEVTIIQNSKKSHSIQIVYEKRDITVIVDFFKSLNGFMAGQNLGKQGHDYTGKHGFSCRSQRSHA